MGPGLWKERKVQRFALGESLAIFPSRDRPKRPVSLKTKSPEGDEMRNDRSGSSSEVGIVEPSRLAGFCLSIIAR